MAVSSSGRRRLLVGANAGVVTVIVVVIAGLLADLAARHRVRWDLSADGTATLAPDTLGTLDALDHSGETVTITAFSSQARDAESELKDRFVRDFLRELEVRSGHVRTAFVDLDVERGVAEDKGVDRYGTVVVEGRGERVDVLDRELFRTRGKKDERRVEFVGEAAIARAVSQVLSDDPRKGYFLVGHGERKLRDGGAEGTARFASLLQAQGWDTDELDLLRDRTRAGPPAIPADATVLFVVGPEGPLTPEEDDAVLLWLRAGGRVGYFVDPGGFVAGFVEEYGMTVASGVVMDDARFLPHDDRPILAYHAHAVTQPMIEAGTSTVFAHAAPLEVGRPPGTDAVELVTTSRTGWIERGHERPPVHDALDGEGPVTAAVAIEAPVAGGVARLAIVGDADVVSDELVAEGPGNAAFAVNLARWLAGDEARAGLVGRPSPVRRVALSEEQFAWLGLLIALVWPMVWLAVGGAVAWARRDR